MEEKKINWTTAHSKGCHLGFKCEYCESQKEGATPSPNDICAHPDCKQKRKDHYTKEEAEQMAKKGVAVICAFVEENSPLGKKLQEEAAEDAYLTARTDNERREDAHTNETPKERKIGHGFLAPDTFDDDSYTGDAVMDG